MPRSTSLLKSAPALLLLLIGPQSGRAAQQIEVVDNSPFTIRDEGTTASLVAVRPLTAAGFGESAKSPVLQQFRLTKNLIAGAAAQFDEVRAELARRALTPDEVPLQKWKEILDISGYTDAYLFNPSKATMASLEDVDLEPKVVMSDYAASPEYKIWDATTIMNMVATGAIDTNNIEVIDVDGAPIETVKFDSRIADKISQIYKSKPFFEEQSPYEAGVLIASLQNGIKQYDSLERSLLQYVGDITFGKPIIYSAAEKDLKLPSSISEEYDVYWIELSASFRGLEDKNITELAVNFAFPEGGIALELIPLQYRPEVQVSTKEAIPRMEVGLEERRFSWLLHGEAVGIGSHKFVVIAGVPRGKAAIDFAMSGHVRLEKGVFGGLFGDGDIAGTDVKVIPITF